MSGLKIALVALGLTLSLRLIYKMGDKLEDVLARSFPTREDEKIWQKYEKCVEERCKGEQTCIEQECYSVLDGKEPGTAPTYSEEVF